MRRLARGRRVTRATALSFFALSVLLGLAQPATAGTAEVPPLELWVAYTAAAGEVNNVTVSIEHPANRFFTVHDSAGVTAGNGCTAVDSTTARCEKAPSVGPGGTLSAAWQVSLGDRDDVARGEGSLMGEEGNDRLSGEGLLTGGNGNDSLSGSGTLEGEAGDDTLAGGPGINTLSGGDGNDVMAGGSGNNVFAGGPGNDVMTGGPRADVFDQADSTSGATSVSGGDDTMSGGGGNDVFGAGTGADGSDRIGGGPGRDTVSYAFRKTAVKADLQGDADDGSKGERDRIGADLENITGGAASNRLTGNGAANKLTGGFDAKKSRVSGGGGNDTLLGGRGRDLIIGGPGRDRVRSGAGKDRLLVRDGSRDKVSCGEGSDRVTADRNDRFVRRVFMKRVDRCERIKRAG